MAPKYEIGQKVIITPVSNQQFYPRDAGIGLYSGKSGEIIDFYWITLRSGEIFYIYRVQIEDSDKDIAVTLHEDELKPFIH